MFALSDLFTVSWFKQFIFCWICCSFHSFLPRGTVLYMELFWVVLKLHSCVMTCLLAAALQTLQVMDRRVLNTKPNQNNP